MLSCVWAAAKQTDAASNHPLELELELLEPELLKRGQSFRASFLGARAGA